MGSLCGEGGFWCCGGPISYRRWGFFFPKVFKHRLNEFGF